MSITFTKPQMTVIERQAVALGVSEAEVVRQFVSFAIGELRGGWTRGPETADCLPTEKES